MSFMCVRDCVCAQARIHRFAMLVSIKMDRGVVPFKHSEETENCYAAPARDASRYLPVNVRQGKCFNIL